MQLMMCSSMFQLYTAIAIKLQFLKDEEVDLLLTDATPAFEKLSKNPELSKLFNSVYFAPYIKASNGFNRIVRSKYYRRLFELFPKHFINKVLKQKWNNYSDVYFSSFNLMALRMQDYLSKKNKNLKTHWIEDGISTYLMMGQYKWSLPESARKRLGIKDFQERFCDVYLFEPSLACLKYDFPIVEIPKPNGIPGLVDAFDAIFMENDNEIEEKFIFFEESFNNDGYTTNDAELINTVYEKLGKKDFVLKHHPRNRMDRFTEVLPTVDFPMFWEYYFFKHNIDDKVLVTVSSNTSFVPYILAKAKPTVVLLYKIFNGTSPIFQSGNFEDYVEKYLLYTDSKVYIPETVEELKEIIEELRGK